MLTYFLIIAYLEIEPKPWLIFGKNVGWVLIIAALTLGAAIPDMIELPKHFNHRSFWHSQTVLYFAILLLLLFDKNTIKFGFVFGYATHLMTDTYSRMGIPKWKAQCPECNGKLVKKEGKYGPFVGCANYPRCDYKP